MVLKGQGRKWGHWGERLYTVTVDISWDGVSFCSYIWVMVSKGQAACGHWGRLCTYIFRSTKTELLMSVELYFVDGTEMVLHSVERLEGETQNSHS